MSCREKSYWDDRSSRTYIYKNERFYTITPVPYYYKRWAVVLHFIRKCIEENGVKSVCDYGCGDGEYLRKLYADVEQKGIVWQGYDISEGMIKKAGELCKDIEFGIAEKGIPEGGDNWNLIYSVAVLAHIDDNVCREIINNFAEHISEGGRIILCEQVGKVRGEGETYVRRTVNEYIDMVKSAGLCVEKHYLIDFWAHRLLFERKIAKKVYQHMKSAKEFERRIEANTHIGFRLLSALFTFISKPYLFHGGKGWGYVLLVIKK